MGDDTEAVREGCKKIIAQTLSTFLKKSIWIRWNQNRSTIISVLKQTEKYISLSLHEMFLKANREEIEALGVFIRRKTGHCQKILNQFIYEKNRSCRHSKIVSTISPQGAVYHLQEILDQCNAQYFESCLDLKITWKTGRLRKNRKTLILGVYDSQAHLIKIDQILDCERVPRYYVEYVVFHEMLHALLGDKIDDKGRRCVHHAEFKKKEKTFLEYPAAKAWEKSVKKQLLQGKW